MEWLPVIFLLSLAVIGSGLLIWWAAAGRHAVKGKAVGGSYYKYVDLLEGEVERRQLMAVSRISRRVAYPGMLYFTSRRVVFTPMRGYDAPESQSVWYDGVRTWEVRNERQIGIGVVILRPEAALSLRTKDDKEYVFWASPGYDIADTSRSILEEALPDARSSRSA